MAPVAVPFRDHSTISGFWEEVGGSGAILHFEADHRVEFQGNRIYRTGGIVEVEGDQIQLCIYGRDVASRLRLESGLLHVKDSDVENERVFRRLPGPPAELEDQPLMLPPPSPVPSGRVEDIQREVRERFREDMDAERGAFGREVGTSAPPSVDPLARFRMLDVTSENRRYLKFLLKEVGWIDAARFGYATSHAVMLMVQHSGDRLLLEAALPWIKQDVEAGLMDGEAYALVYDRLQLSLGKKQLYATQVGRDANDLPLIYPTEEPKDVDRLRKELGMSPIAEYVKLFGTSEVRFSSACSGLEPTPRTVTPAPAPAG
jgi:hypothetical protein